MSCAPVHMQCACDLKQASTASKEARQGYYERPNHYNTEYEDDRMQHDVQPFRW